MDVLLGRLQAGDVTPHLLLADGQLVDALPQRGEIARHRLELLLHVGRRGGGRGRRGNVRSSLSRGCSLRWIRRGFLSGRWAQSLGDEPSAGRRLKRGQQYHPPDRRGPTRKLPLGGLAVGLPS